jgi:hypothetical protein
MQRTESLRSAFLAIAVAAAVSFSSVAAQSPSPLPRHAIRDSASAIRIAEVILTSAYGDKSMQGSRPYQAVLVDGVWKVTGTVPKDALGSPLFVDLDQQAGCVVALGIRY